MFEIVATLAVLMIGGACVALVATAGIVFVSLFKLALFPLAVVFDLVKWIVLVVVVPLVVFVVIPIALLVLVPVMLAVMIPIVIGLMVVAVPLLLLGIATHAL